MRRRRETASKQSKILALRRLAVDLITLRKVLTWVAAVEADRFNRVLEAPVRKVVEAMVASVSVAEAESPTDLLLVGPGNHQVWMDRVMQQASRVLPLILPATVASR